MANKPIPSNPIADLPANWVGGQIVSPNGTEVGLSQKYGYNYLNSKVNEALADLKLINDAFPGLAETDDVETLSTKLTDLKMLGWTVPEEMPIQNYTLNGVYHQRVGRVDLGSIDYLNNPTLISLGIYVVSSIPNRKSNGSEAAVYCRNFRTVVATSWVNMGNYEIRQIKGDENLRFCITDKTSMDAFKSAVSGVYLYYELATEITRTIDGNEWTARISNPNLLDNPWFTVNQRGNNTYTANEYTVDRWKKSTNGTLTVIDKGIHLSANNGDLYLNQFYESDLISQLTGKTVTYSIKVSNVVGDCSIRSLGLAKTLSNGLNVSTITFTNTTTSVYILCTMVVRVMLNV